MGFAVAAAVAALVSVPGFGQATRPDYRGLERLERWGRADSAWQLELLKKYDQARSAALEMVCTAGDLKDVVLRHGTPGLGPDSLQDVVKRHCRQIRDLTKPVREVSLLDPSDQDRASSYEKTEDAGELAMLVYEMESLADSIRLRLDSLAGYNVAVGDLKTPSLEALIKNAQRLSKTIEKSAKELF